MYAVRRRHRGILITFEGIEGSGKSTQCAILAKELCSRGYRVIETREPGGTPLAEAARRLLLHPDCNEHVTPAAEACLVLAGRAQHVQHVIDPALKEGAVVLCDRFTESTLAYQGYGRGLDVEQLRTLNHLATGGLQPTLTLLFDLPVAAGLARRRRAHEERNRLDREVNTFHERVRRGFLALAREEPGRIVIVDARVDPDHVARDVKEAVLPLLAKTAVRRVRVFQKGGRGRSRETMNT
jgi:dTMP kinase